MILIGWLLFPPVTCFRWVAAGTKGGNIFHAVMRQATPVSHAMSRVVKQWAIQWGANLHWVEMEVAKNSSRLVWVLCQLMALKTQGNSTSREEGSLSSQIYWVPCVNKHSHSNEDSSLSGKSSKGNLTIRGFQECTLRTHFDWNILAKAEFLSNENDCSINFVRWRTFLVNCNSMSSHPKSIPTIGITLTPGPTDPQGSGWNQCKYDRAERGETLK